MLARACVVLLAMVQTTFALLLVAGHSRFSGRMLAALSPDHGIDSGDLPILVLWAVGMGCCYALWVKVSASVD